MTPATNPQTKPYPRRDGWTAERRQAFLDCLAAGLDVRRACARRLRPASGASSNRWPSGPGPGRSGRARRVSVNFALAKSRPAAVSTMSRRCRLRPAVMRFGLTFA